MNRRNFLVRLGVAATGAAATLVVDPEQLLWTPGKKTIIDFGATKQVLPASDAEMLAHGKAIIAASTPLGRESAWVREQFLRDPLLDPRDIRLDINNGRGVTSFHYKDDTLVSVHSPEELKLLDKTWEHPMEAWYRTRR